MRDSTMNETQAPLLLGQNVLARVVAAQQVSPNLRCSTDDVLQLLTR